jgi:hypothetical protein
MKIETTVDVEIESDVFLNLVLSVLVFFICC